jgi:hypothetical protein
LLAAVENVLWFVASERNVGAATTLPEFAITPLTMGSLAQANR